MRLVTSKHSHTRPSLDRTKETLFNTLQSLAPIPEKVVDLFAGSGALGIEAWSRGAEEVIFVEKSPLACKYINKNLNKINKASFGKIITGDVFDYLKSCVNESISLVLADPPYGEPMANRVLQRIVVSRLISPGGIFVLEKAKDDNLIIPGQLHLIKNKQCGNSQLLFFKMLEM